MSEVITISREPMTEKEKAEHDIGVNQYEANRRITAWNLNRERHLMMNNGGKCEGLGDITQALHDSAAICEFLTSGKVPEKADPKVSVTLGGNNVTPLVRPNCNGSE